MDENEARTTLITTFSALIIGIGGIFIVNVTGIIMPQWAWVLSIGSAIGTGIALLYLGTILKKLNKKKEEEKEMHYE